MVKNLPANARDLGLIPGSGRSAKEGNGNPLQYSCLGNPMDRGSWWATVHGVAESGMTERAHTHIHTRNGDEDNRKETCERTGKIWSNGFLGDK